MKLNDIELKQIQRTLSTFTTEDERVSSSLTFNGRMFEVVQQDDDSYFVSEYTPTGVLFTGGKTSDSRNFDYTHMDTLPKAYRADPNGFLAYCKANGIVIDHLCRGGGGYGIGTIYHSSLISAISAVVHALKDNEVVKHRLTPDEIAATKSPDQLKQEKIDALRASLSYWTNNLMTEAETPTLFSDKRGMLGSPIPEDYRKKILAYINRPTLEAWEDIRGIVITRESTIWQTLVAHDPMTPRLGSGFNASNIPSAETLVTVFSKAVALHNEECRRRVAEAAEKLDKLGDEAEAATATQLQAVH